MELPIKITGDNILIDEINIVDNKFCSLVLGRKVIVRRAYCQIEYTFDNGLKCDEIFNHINQEVFLTSEIVGVEMCTYIRDENKAQPYYMKVIIYFKGGHQTFMCFKDEDKGKEAFRIVNDFFYFINDI